MNLPRFTENVNIHQSLPDQPTLTPTELKIKWDEGVSKIKEFLNDILLPALEDDISEEFASLNKYIRYISKKFKQFIKYNKQQRISITKKLK